MSLLPPPPRGMDVGHRTQPGDSGVSVGASRGTHHGARRLRDPLRIELRQMANDTGVEQVDKDVDEFRCQLGTSNTQKLATASASLNPRRYGRSARIDAYASHTEMICASIRMSLPRSPLGYPLPS